MRYKTNRYETEIESYAGAGDQVMFKVMIFGVGTGPTVHLYLTPEDVSMFIRALKENDQFLGYHAERTQGI